MYCFDAHWNCLHVACQQLALLHLALPCGLLQGWVLHGWESKDRGHAILDTEAKWCSVFHQTWIDAANEQMVPLVENRDGSHQFDPICLFIRHLIFWAFKNLTLYLYFCFKYPRVSPCLQYSLKTPQGLWKGHGIHVKFFSLNQCC